MTSSGSSFVEKSERPPLSAKRQRAWLIMLSIGFVSVGLFIGWLGLQFATGCLSFTPHQ